MLMNVNVKSGVRGAARKVNTGLITGGARFRPSTVFLYVYIYIYFRPKSSYRVYITPFAITPRFSGLEPHISG